MPATTPLAIPTPAPRAACLPTPVSPTAPTKRAALHIDTAAAAARQPRPLTPTSPRHRQPGSAYPYYTPRRLRAGSTASSSTPTPTSALQSAEDPYRDITRLRPPPAPQHPCLYPGATFRGTQRSGRHAYEVGVTLATVDLTSPAPHLCGYLRIKGLTDDYPELTTYFDAELVTPAGPATFRTPRSWGACERRDWEHWSKFPAFRRMHVPSLDSAPTSGGSAVFMRWKEKFLVPDHRVKDITGASFAGFYYVCVDLDPQATANANAQAGRRKQRSQPAPAAHSPTPTVASLTSAASNKTPVAEPENDTPFPPREPFTDAMDVIEEEEDDVPPGTGALMSGYYFHPHSDPFQKLTLRHVPDACGAAFEFR
ncbi:hypothetical protein AURDEDRAFT_115133 [Auricularia subglabra TFB-10046 SS5]|nr:hypothetical protein AURDEDRAFT_115133 [Auricularia subglabra TFB-10046 SS5]